MNPNPAEPAMPDDLPVLPAIHRADTRSRLRSGGLLRAAAGLAACAAAATAQASVVYSGDLGAAGVITADAPQVLSQNFSIEGVDQFFLLSQTTSGKGGGTQTNFYVITVDPSLNFALLNNSVFLPSGTWVGPDSDFSTYSIPGVTDTLSYFGFRTDPTSSGSYLYGWGQLELISSTQFALRGYAYEDSGAAILVGDIGDAANALPEPGSLPLVAAAGAALVLMQRRRR